MDCMQTNRPKPTAVKQSGFAAELLQQCSQPDPWVQLESQATDSGESGYGSDVTK